LKPVSSSFRPAIFLASSAVRLTVGRPGRRRQILERGRQRHRRGAGGGPGARVDQLFEGEVQVEGVAERLVGGPVEDGERFPAAGAAAGNELIAPERVAVRFPVVAVVELQSGGVLQLVQDLRLVGNVGDLDHELVLPFEGDGRFGDPVGVDALLDDVLDRVLGVLIPGLPLRQLGRVGFEHDARAALDVEAELGARQEGGGAGTDGQDQDDQG
jgi:hypothetical protein